jgi:hypothetical protein
MCLCSIQTRGSGLQEIQVRSPIRLFASSSLVLVGFKTALLIVRSSLSFHPRVYSKALLYHSSHQAVLTYVLPYYG